MTTMGVAIVGCGDIAHKYAEDLPRHPHLRLVGVTDLDLDRARAFAERWGTVAFDSLDAALADPEVELIACLTSHRAHVPVTIAALRAGRRVFSEKPMAPTRAEADALIQLADRQGVRLAAAPIAPLGELQQTARRWVESGRLGEVRLAYADVNWGRIERWHPQPDAFYEIGPLYDVGVYPLTALTALFGPVVEVRADAARLLEDRRRLDGGAFRLGAPDAVVALLRLAGGPLVRLTVNFYVADPARQRGIELHGDAGSLWLSNWFQFDGTLEHASQGEEYRPVPLLRSPEVVMPWATGLEELAASIVEDRAPALDPRHAAHVVEVMETIVAAADEGRAIPIGSTFDPPRPAAWTVELQLAD
jgi:predicted dehydrogenase